MSSRIRTDRIAGSITLAGGGTISINDSVLVKDTLKITRELCSGKFRIGTFCLSKLKFSFFLADALGLDLAGAYCDLSYGILVGEDVYENVPLGRFYIDPVLSTRRKDIVSIVAFDAGVMFDREPSAALRATNAAPPALIAAVCAECGVPTDIAAGSLTGLPNSTLSVNAEDRQIQSCRDIVMWCASLMCGYAVIGRDGKLCVIPAKYDVEPLDPAVIVVDRNIREDERDSINATDTRAYIKYLTAYAGSDVVNYTSAYVAQDEQASAASYTLDKNPLLAGLTAQQCGQANEDWLAYIDSFKQRGVEARIFGDPAIDTGDTIMFRGGDVDQRAGIAGIVTGIEWRYRGYTDITCLAAQCCGSLENGGSQSARLPQVRTQSQKRMDSLSPGTGGTGTGKWLDSAHTSVAHCDIINNSSHGMYDSVDGYKNAITGTSTISNDHITHGGNTVTGQHNTLTDCTNTLVCGQDNQAATCYDTVITGRENDAEHVLYSTLSGSFNTVHDYIYNMVLAGSHITVSSCSDSVIAGYGHYIGSAHSCIMCGNYGTTLDATVCFAVGHGTPNNRQNVLTIKNIGDIHTQGQLYPGGADYAEYFEWLDGNPDSEDRRGMLVTLDGDRIIPAHGNDFIGVISANPSVVGNNAEMHWHGKYEQDVFGCVLYDEAGKPVISDEYREQKYIPRSQRPEWALVGLVGRLVITDDGSCKPGGYVSARRGKGTSCYAPTNARVLRRIDETHVEVLIR